MYTYKREEQKEMRSYPVKKSNVLIQNTVCMLKAQEFDVLQYLIMKIKDDDEEIKPVKFDIVEYCKVANIKASGNNYARVKESLKALADKSVWTKFPNSDEEQLVRWIEDPSISKDGEITIQLKKIWEPYLLDLKKRYTVTTLSETLPMKSVYSKRLYELLVSYTIDKKGYNHIEFSVNEIKQLLLGKDWRKKYKEFKHFNSRVLLIAVKEINEYGEIHVDLDYVKKSRSVKSIIFITSRKGTQEIVDTTFNRKDYFDTKDEEIKEK